MLFALRRHRIFKLLSRASTSEAVASLSIREKLKNGPGLKEFISGHQIPLQPPINIPYLQNLPRQNQKVFFDVYGCQMNVNDTEIVWSILKDQGFIRTEIEDEADVVLVITCAIREGAESKVWHRLNDLRGLKRRRNAYSDRPLTVGVLGCMAERLKEKLIEKEKSVDIVCGPDSYRDLPRLLAVTESGQAGVNVMLSMDETYADVMPVRLNQDSVTAFVSIMRGCDNMCTYCIVPFTRGRERSRPVGSILEEVRSLSEQGVKEVTLLGQNVNSYRDLSEPTDPLETRQVDGFRTVYKKKKGGLRFADLLDRVSRVAPEMRIRFTSPHPKDFPDEVLHLIASRPNICKMLHLPVQAGSSSVLERMRRGYTREAYVALADRVKAQVDGVALSSDFICGFCGETDSEFEQTMSMMERVDYHVSYIFQYSMREKTTAHRRFTDDVPEEVKRDRVMKLSALFRRRADLLNKQQIGKTNLILIEGRSKKSDQFLAGRNEHNIKVIVPKVAVDGVDGVKKELKAGDFVSVRVTDANSQVLKGVPLLRTSISQYYADTC